MKTILPLLFSALFFLNVSAQDTPTASDVSANVASLVSQAQSDSADQDEAEAAILAIITQQIQLYPQFASEIVSAAIGATTNPSNAFVGQIVSAALQAVPADNDGLSIELAAREAAPSAGLEITQAMLDNGRQVAAIPDPTDLVTGELSSVSGLTDTLTNEDGDTGSSNADGDGTGGETPVVTNPNP